jgi:hypothetical protein
LNNPFGLFSQFPLRKLAVILTCGEVRIPTHEQQGFISYISTLTLICNAHKKRAVRLEIITTLCRRDPNGN